MDSPCGKCALSISPGRKGNDLAHIAKVKTSHAFSVMEKKKYGVPIFQEVVRKASEQGPFLNWL